MFFTTSDTKYQANALSAVIVKDTSVANVAFEGPQIRERS